MLVSPLKLALRTFGVPRDRSGRPTIEASDFEPGTVGVPMTPTRLGEWPIAVVARREAFIHPASFADSAEGFRVFGGHLDSLARSSDLRTRRPNHRVSAGGEREGRTCDGSASTARCTYSTSVYAHSSSAGHAAARLFVPRVGRFSAARGTTGRFAATHSSCTG